MMSKKFRIKGNEGYFEGFREFHGTTIPIFRIITKFEELKLVPVYDREKSKRIIEKLGQGTLEEVTEDD